MDKTSARNNLTLQSIYVVVVVVQLAVIASVSGDSQFMDSCGNCSCNWSSGKKAANCMNLSFNTIPRYLSSELQIVDFSQNSIAEIQKNEFIEANLQNLHKLFLRNCTLMELNRDAFKGLSVLIELDLSHNLLSELHPETFALLEKLRYLLLNNNNLDYLPEGIFMDLKHIQKVELKHNRIARIAPNTFNNLPELRFIELPFNNLTILKLSSFQNLPKLMTVTLEENPWNCTCHLFEFRKYVVEKKYYSNPPACFTPPHLHGKLWDEIGGEEFACRPEIMQPERGGRRQPITYNADAASENVTLTCRVRAAPQLNIAWTYNKRVISRNDRKFQVLNKIEPNQIDEMNVYTSELKVARLRSQDKGLYACIVENAGGRDTAEFQLTVTSGLLRHTESSESSSDIILIICVIAVSVLLLLIVVALILCLYCRRSKRFSKDGAANDSSLDKTQNTSMLEGGSVITDVQKSLLSSVNPVEKPPRRAADVDSLDAEDSHEIKKTLLDEPTYGSRDEETHSIALSDTTPRSRQTFVDDSHGTNLPPDLLSFQANLPQSPSMQSSMSNIPDSRIYGKSPLASPIYQHVANQSPGGGAGGGSVYGVAPVAFRTLQHPKNKNLALLNSPRTNSSSPFVPAPIVYPAVVMKQGYMTIPRKPRTPSWTPSCSTTLSEFQSIKGVPNGTVEGVEPVYDNLGIRTTASGNSMLSLTKVGVANNLLNGSPVRYTMKDRPLPATPSFNVNGVPNSANTPTRIYEPIQEASNLVTTSDTEPLYGSTRSGNHGKIVPGSSDGMPVIGTLDRISKIPPRPPPKPKKKMSAISTNVGSTSKLFEDEGEDGTEV